MSRRSGIGSSPPPARVFAEKGYHSSTIADVVRESGLSVGAIYTYFSGKDELIRLTCDQIAARGLDELAARARAGDDDRRTAGHRHPPVRRDDRRVRRRARARSRSSRRGPRPTASPASARCWPAGASGWPAPARCSSRQGVVNGELPASLDVDAVTRGLLALLDGLMLQRIEAGDAYRPADLERRATAIVELLLGARSAPAGRPGARRDGVASPAMAHVQTVLGPIDPDALGFTLPHEHTQIALWHIQARWDYWQLTRDEPVILEELARVPGRRRERPGRPDAARRRARPGLAARPGRGERPARRHGLRLVSDRLLPAGGADRPAVRGRPRRRARRARSRTGWGRPASGPGSSARSGPTSRGSRRPRSGSIGRSRGRRGGPASRSRPTPCCPTSGSPSSAIFEEEGADPGRVVIGHADSYPVLDHYLAIVERGANLEFDFIGMPWERERIGEARTIELVCELLGRGHADRLFLSQDVCNDSQLKAFGGNGYTYLTDTFLPRLRAAGVSDAEIETMTVANPRRLLTIG